jgi:acetyl coenzyme A synthetase (ADP forming)-like protein
MPANLLALFRPRSVAVVGASRTRSTIGYEVLRNLLRGGFTGAVYPVNAKSPVVQSLKAWPTVSAIPDPVDLAILVLPAAAVLETVEDCGKKGVKALIVITAGFAETGLAGAALQDTLRERIHHYGMRMVGPNCLGVVNADPAVSMNATFAPTFPPFGNVAFSSQSGALGLAILDQASALGVGISQFVSLGNKADLSGNDLLEYWEQDDATQVILLYLESLGNPQRFMEISRRVSRKKPIVVVKAGRTDAGARAASSHTGSLAGLDVAVEALLGQAGVIRTDTIHELFEVAGLLANQPPPAGKRVAIVTNAGGPGILASDACESRGLVVASLDRDSQHALRGFLPPEASVLNPVDMIASASPAAYERALRIVLDAPGINAALVLFVTPIVTDPKAVADAIIAASAGSKKPVVVCMMGRQGVPEATATLRAARIPVYDFPESAAAALARAADYGTWLQSPEGKLVGPAGFSLAKARQVVDAASHAPEGRWLRPEETHSLLEAAGLRTARGVEAQSAGEAAMRADELGYPVVVKLLSDTITHKSDVGGVELNLRSALEVRGAWTRIEGRLQATGQRDQMRGVLVQQQVARGVETFLGATRDAKFGALVGFGIGGTAVEVWKDVAFRVAPLRDTDAASMVQQIRGRPLLEGFRGGPVASKAALIDALLRVSALVTGCPEIAELDLNPVMALEDGVVVADARVRVAQP